MFVTGDLSKRPILLKTLTTLQWFLVALRINPTLPNWLTKPVRSGLQVPHLPSPRPQPDCSLSSELKGDLPREVDASGEVR